jgi:hypothetical protein
MQRQPAACRTDFGSITMTACSPRSTKAKAWLQLTLICGVLFAGVARADDLAGLWTTNAENCQKVFTRTGQGFAFAHDADLYGSGLIIDERRIVSKMAQCTIKTRQQDGAIAHLIATCATDIMLSNVQASFRMLGKDRMLRMFPGVSDLEMQFERCVLK